MFEMEAPEGVNVLMVASIITVTELSGSRQETFTVTVCATVELLVKNAMPPEQVPLWVA